MAEPAASSSSTGRRVALALEPNSATFVFKWAENHIFHVGDDVYFINCVPDFKQSVLPLSFGGVNMPGFKPVLTPVADLQGEKQRQDEEYEHFIKPYMDKARTLGLIPHSILLRGEARDLIVDATEELAIDTLVMGSRGMGRMKRALLGSVSSYCVHHCLCAVVIVKKESETHQQQNIE